MLTGWAVAIAAILASLWALGGAPRTVGAQVDLAALRQQFFDAVNAGDLDAAVAFFTEDSVLDGLPPCDVHPCVGREAIRAVFEGFVADNTQFTSISVEVSANTVIGRIEVTTDLLQLGGIERILAKDTSEWTGDKVSSMVVELDRTDQQTAAVFGPPGLFGPPVAGTGGFLAEDSSGIPGWWYALVAAGALLMIVGFARLRRARSP